jgi:hypothetical protein
MEPRRPSLNVRTIQSIRPARQLSGLLVPVAFVLCKTDLCYTVISACPKKDSKMLLPPEDDETAREEAAREEDARVDEAEEESFPASDPPASYNFS